MKTIKSLALAAAIVATPAFLTACGGDENNYDAKVHYSDAKTTISGKIRNGVTNEAIDDKSLEVKLFQGDKVRKAKLFKNEAGYYSITDIPTSTDNNSNEFRFEVKADGYIPFEGVVEVDYQATNYGQNVQDKKQFWVGNVYLYPIGFKTPSYDVVVKYNNQRVEGVEVIAELIGVNNTANAQGGTFGASITSTDDLSRVQTTTDANGVARFVGSELVLNGSYQFSVLPTQADGLTLYRAAAGTDLTVGTNKLEHAISLTSLVSGTAEGLFIESASNEYQDALPDGSGKLVLTFSKEVEVVPSTATATLAGILDGGALEAGSDAVTVTVSADGKVVTLSPNYATDLGENSKNVNITYANLVVNIKGINKQVDVFAAAPDDVKTSSGIALSGKVQISLP